MLGGAGERPDIRTAAAIALGRIATDASERLLLEGLAQAHSPTRLRQAIALALGRTGGEAALALLDECGRSTERPVAQAARFGAALVAHRLGLAGHDLPLPEASKLLPPLSPPGARPIAFAPAPPDLGAQVIDDLRSFPYRFVDYDQDSILANSIGFVLLATPAGDEVNLQVVTASGRPTFFGTARRAGTDLAFELRALARPGARAALIAGALSGGRVTVHDAVSSAFREPPRRPQLAGRSARGASTSQGRRD